MKIRRKPEVITNKGLIIAGVILVVLIAVGIIAWSLMAVAAEKNFAADMTQAKKSIFAELNDKTVQLQAVVKQNDTGKTADFLSAFASAVDTDVVNVPAQTYFAGLPLVGNARVQNAEDLKAALDKLATALHASADILGYEHNVFEPLFAAKSLVANDVKQQTQIAQTWAGLQDKLNAMQVPEALTNVHATITNLVASIHSALASLPEATTKHDQRLTSAISNAISGYTGQIQRLGPTFQELGKTADQNFNEALKAAQDALQ